MLMGNHRHGFRSNKSTITCTGGDLYQTFIEASECPAFFDLSGTFDCINHCCRLLSKLYSFGIRRCQIML